MRRIGNVLGDSVSHPAQLLHKIRLGVQAAGGVDNYNIKAVRTGFGNAIKNYSAGLRTLDATIHFDIQKLAPSGAPSAPTTTAYF